MSNTEAMQNMISRYQQNVHPNLRKLFIDRSCSPLYATISWYTVKKTVLHLSINVFNVKELNEDTIFYVSLWRWITIGHLSHVKVLLFAGQRKYLHFSVTLRP